MTREVAEPAAQLALDRRRALLRGPVRPGRELRRALSAATDDWLRQLYAGARAQVGVPPGTVLVAVGGYGRGELSPGSDLDLLLLTAAGSAVGELADRLWYPVWDSGLALDHAVRTLTQARRLAGEDSRVLLGLLHARALCGDEAGRESLAGLRTAVLADWRAGATRRLPELREQWRERGERYGELAHSLEPDLKEGAGGLRDVVALEAVAASWVADRPHATVDAAAEHIADLRDALHLSTGRAGNRLVAQEQEAVAQRLGLAGRDEVLRRAAEAGRAVAYAGELTWRRVGQVLDGPTRRRFVPRPGRRVPVRRPLAPGLQEWDGEVVLGPDARPGEDPALPFSAAAAAARAGLTLSPAMLDVLSDACPPMPDPWPAPARTALLALLGAGAPAVALWEALDQAGLVVRALPEWELVRFRPQRNAVHRWTVDRHLVETAAAAAALARRVARPDLLLLAALLHDHGAAGPAPGRWAEGGARLVAGLAERARAHLRGQPPPPAPLAPALSDAQRDLVSQGGVAVEVSPGQDSDDGSTDGEWTVTVAARDRAGLLAAVAGVLALHRLPVRSATLHAADGIALDVWSVGSERGDPPRCAALREDLGRALAGALDVPGLLARRDAETRRAHARSHLARLDAARPVAPPRAEVVPAASERATVLEVRAADAPGLLHRLGSSLAASNVDVRAARVSTYGTQAVDVFYVVGEDGAPLPPARAGRVAVALAEAAAPAMPTSPDQREP